MKKRPTVRQRERAQVLRSVRALHSRVAVWRSRPSLVQLWRPLRFYYQYDSNSEDDDTSPNASDSKEDHESCEASDFEEDTCDEYRTTVKSPDMDLCGENSNYCFLTSTYPLSTTLDKLESGASIGRRCCKTVLDAIQTWEQHPAVRKLLKAHSSLLQDNDSVELHWNWRNSTHGKAANSIIKLSYSGKLYQLRMFLPEGEFGFPVSAPDIASICTFPTERLVAGGTSSLESSQRLFHWLDECTATHPACQKSDFSPADDRVGTISQYRLPKRILEIVGHCVELRENMISKDPYICLSHCWGSKGIPFKLERSTIGLLKGGIAISALPKTFRDAVLVCLRLGFRFIWIDALCIIQDSTEDWEEAVAVMADVYENGLFTIAATAAEDSNGGLFSDSGSPFSPKKLRDSDLHIAQERNYDLQDFGRAPLLSRAWVFQERILSSRVIHFTETQIIWECCSMLKSESGHPNYDWTNGPYDSPLRHLYKLPIKNTTRSWHDTVTAYSKLKLTYANDRLPALAAIVERKMQSRPNDEYIAGLWKMTFLQDLLWCTLNRANTPMRPKIEVPTWSWASVGIGVSYPAPSQLYSAALLDVKYKNAGPAQLGDVTDASIVLRGHSCTALVKGLNMFEFINDVVQPRDRIVSSMDGSLFSPDYDSFQEGSRQIKTGDTVTILFISSSTGPPYVQWTSLVLKDFTPGLYERIGCLSKSSEYPLKSGVSRRSSLEDSLDFRLTQHFVLSQPFRTFTIV